MLRKLHIILFLFCSYVCVSFADPTGSTDQVEQPVQVDYIKQAKDFLQNISDEAIKLTNDKSLSSAELNKKLNEMFNGHVNTKWMAKFVLGRHWNSIDPTMKQHFISVYHDYLTNTYLPKLKNYTIGTSVSIESASQLSPGDYMVFTRLNRPNQQPIEVDYRLKLADDNNFDIVDIIAEGVSLLNTQRTEFSAIIEQNGVNDLINSLRKVADNPNLTNPNAN